MCAPRAPQAYELVEAAEKRLKAFVMPLIGSKDAKYEDAAELYQKAGNAFKVSKNFQEAGDAFKNAAGCFQKISSQHEAATAFQEAGNAYKKVDSAQAVAMLQLTIDILSDLGRFSQVSPPRERRAVAVPLASEPPHRGLRQGGSFACIGLRMRRARLAPDWPCARARARDLWTRR